MIPDNIGESEYTLKQSLPFDLNEELAAMRIGDFTHPLSDEEVRYNIYSLLRSHEDIDQDDIRVDCLNGVVILTGLVNNEDMSQLCTRLCEFVPGVKEVINGLDF